MNKTLSVLLCLATLLSLCACGNSESAEDTELIKLSSETNTAFKKSEESASSWNEDFVSDDGPIEHYAFHDYSNTDNSYTDAIPDGLSVDLRAVTTAEGTPYELWVNNNEDADFRNHSFSAFALIPDGLFSGGIDYEERENRLTEWYLQMGLCSTFPASQDELSTVSEHASNIASQMGLGEWRFIAKAIDIGNDAWQIELTGQPIYRGVPVSWQNPNEHQDFYLESLTIHTANSGKLVDFNYTSPLELIEIVEQSVPLKTWDAIEPIAEQLMQKWSCKKLIPNYEPGKMWWDKVGAEIIKTKVDIDTVCVGYSRVPYDSTDYLLIPTVTFPGKLEVVGKIPGAEEAFDLLIADDTAYNVSLILDLKTGTPIE